MLNKNNREKFLRENPEFETVEEYIQYLHDDERTEFSGLDLITLAEIHNLNHKELRAQLEGEGFKLQERRPKRPNDIRGFKSEERTEKLFAGVE